MTRRVGLLVLTVTGMVGAGPAHAQDETYADAITQALIERAATRFRAQEARLERYRAEVYTRMEGGVGPGRFSRGLNVIAYESIAKVQWQRPNDLRVDLVGMRLRSFPIPGLSARSLAAFWAQTFSSEPWFVPRALDQEIQMLGIPDEAAVHPLARDAQQLYTYAIVDSIALALPGRLVRAIAVEVKPKAYGRPMLVSGNMWLDADSLDVVRLAVAFVGDGLWEDNDPDAPTLVQLEADLEYALHEGAFWLPLRQILTGAWTYRYMPGAKLRSTAITTFSKFEIDPADPVVFTGRTGRRRWWVEWDCDDARGYGCGERGRTLADRWEDGRWEVHLPSLDSLTAYDFGTEFQFHEDLLDEELLAQRLTELAAQSEALPNAWTGRRLLNLDWSEALRFVGFNRVQGISLALGTELRPGFAFTSVGVNGRYSAATEQLTGSVALRRAAPRGLIEVEGYRRVLDVEPWTQGDGVGNTVKALVLGHDDADYYLATGGGVSFHGYRGRTRDWRFGFQVERQRSLPTASGSALHDVFFGDGKFQPNPEIAEGDFVRVRAERYVPLGSSVIRFGTGALMGEGLLSGRGWVSATIPFQIGASRSVLGLRGGSVVGDRTPQTDFRLGGPATVRGYTYGVRRSSAFWSAQLESVLSGNQWVAPVVFADAGGLFDGKPLLAVGAGVSAVKGWFRLDFAKSLVSPEPLRVDIVFRAPR